MGKKFCAHRGLSALMPENTLPAFAAACALGAHEIEFDVRLTKDNRLIVSHDALLDRISNGSGQVCDFTLQELKKLNIGIKTTPISDVPHKKYVSKSKKSITKV